MVIDLHPGVAALLIVVVAWFTNKLINHVVKIDHNPEDFK